MDIKEFIEHFAEQFDDTAAEVFKPETEFKAFRNAKTIEDLYRIVECKK